MKEKIRNYLQMFRAQTAPETFIIGLVPFLMDEFKIEVAIILFVILTLSHWLSFGHNSLMDTQAGYDIKDPAKQHHPLVRGAIPLIHAHQIIHISLFFMSLIMITLTLIFAQNITLGLIGMIIFIVAGHAYNDGLDKNWILSFLALAISFIGVTIWTYSFNHTEISYKMTLLIIYMLFLLTFQIAFEGSLKDFELMEPSNLIYKLGTRITIFENEKYFSPTSRMIFVALFIKSGMLITSFLMFVELWNNDPLQLIYFSALTIISIYYMNTEILPGKFDRQATLKNMSLHDIACIYVIIPLYLGWIVGITLMTFGVLYFFVMNKLLWESNWPQV